jgi:hypothetical protein
MFFRGANLIEGGGTWFFRKIFLSPIRTKLRWVIELGWVEFRHRESSGQRPDLLVWEPKIWFFFVFCEFLLNEKSEVNFFRLKRSALKRGIQRSRICHIIFNNNPYVHFLICIICTNMAWQLNASFNPVSVSPKYGNYFVRRFWIYVIN